MHGGAALDLADDVEAFLNLAEAAQMAIDKYFADNQMGVSDIEAMLSEHMRTPYSHAQE